MKSLRMMMSLSMLTVCGLANAVVVTINPSYYAAGTDLSHATEGVTLSTWSWQSGSPEEPTYAPVYATDCLGCGAFNGQRVFGNGYYSAGATAFAGAAFASNYLLDYDARGFSVFRADFAAPTNFVQLLMGGYGEDFAGVSAFDLEGNLVAECNFYGNAVDPPCGTYITQEVDDRRRAVLLTLNTGLDNIALLVAGGGDAGSNVASMTFVRKAVPEPMGLGLLLCGSAGMWATRRRRCYVIVLGSLREPHTKTQTELGFSCVGSFWPFVASDWCD